jgi:hypothetical protein
MSELSKAIKTKVLEPHLNQFYDMIKATILEYDNSHNRAKIKFDDPRGSGFIELEDVPVQLGSGGVSSSGPFIDDEVWISFENKNIFSPKIVSLCDEQFNNKTKERFNHSLQGAYLPEEEENTDIDFDGFMPLYNDWIDNDNNDYSLYTDYIIDPIEEMNTVLNDCKYYSTSELGLTHPFNRSTIKIKDNGNIDIFIEDSQGIRINTIDKSINFFTINETHNVSNWTINSTNVNFNCTSFKINGKEFNE